jgi:Amt family ammonium transporter
VLLEYRWRYDDSLDAFGLHGVGGVVGALLTGVFSRSWVFSDAAAPIGGDGLLLGGFKQFGVQILATLAAVAYAVLVTWGILKFVGAVVGLRVSEADEREGLDTSLHGEEGYAG